MKKILFIILMIIISIGIFSYKKNNTDNNTYSKISIEEILEYGNKIESMDLLPNTIIAKLNGEPILFREIGTKKIQLDYSKNNSNQENYEEKNAFYEILVEKLYIEYAKKYPNEVEYNLNIDQTIEKTKKELTDGYEGKTPEECKKEMLDIMCIKEDDVWFGDDDFIPYVQSMQVDSMLTAKGNSIISKFMLEKPELAKDKELEQKVEEYNKIKEKQVELIKANSTKDLMSSMNNNLNLLEEIRELYIKDLLLNSKIELCVEANELYKEIPQIYRYNNSTDSNEKENITDNENIISTTIINNEDQTADNSVEISNKNNSDIPSNSDFNKIYSDAIKNLDTNYFLKDQENYFPESNEVIISETRAREIAEIGFQESARRIAGEGVENKASERVKLEDKLSNNYFTRQYLEGDKMYKTSVRKCYVVTRENDMGCGVSIYVDATTGLIIGGEAFGD